VGALRDTTPQVGEIREGKETRKEKGVRSFDGKGSQGKGKSSEKRRR